MAYKHIIWDWNGTLLNDRHFCIEIMNNVLKRRQMSPMTEEWFLENFCFPVKEYYKKLGFDLEKEPFEISGDEFIHEYMERIHEPNLHLNAMDTMKNMDRMGVTQSLLSASSQAMLDATLKFHHIERFFIKVMGQDNHYAYGKEEMGKRWVDELNHGPHEILFVGDTLHDKEVADLIGADCALISHGHVSQSRLENTGAPVFPSLIEMLDWVRNSG